MVFVLIFLMGLACRFSVNEPQSPVLTNEPPQPTVTQLPLQVTPTLLVVLTNTPKSYPSKFQSWLVGDWQWVESGEILQFTVDYHFYQDGYEGIYRFLSDTELIMIQNGEENQVELWQVDQNTMFINSPDGLSHKLIRVSP